MLILIISTRDEFSEYFNYDFYKAYDLWNLSLINSDFNLFQK